jgi:hypothetical protein
MAQTREALNVMTYQMFKRRVLRNLILLVMINLKTMTKMTREKLSILEETQIEALMSMLQVKVTAVVILASKIIVDFLI